MSCGSPFIQSVFIMYTYFRFIYRRILLAYYRDFPHFYSFCTCNTPFASILFAMFRLHRCSLPVCSYSLSLCNDFSFHPRIFSCQFNIYQISNVFILFLCVCESVIHNMYFFRLFKRFY